MNTTSDLFTLRLADGLKVIVGDKEQRYKSVKLREIGVPEERAACRMAERVVQVGNRPQLMVSESDYRYALNLGHIAAIYAEGGGRVEGSEMDLDSLKLSLHDMSLIEDRIFLINLAAKVRYGLITQEQFDAFVSGKAPQQASPQPVGQASGVGASAAGTESGPQMLADFSGKNAPVEVGGGFGLPDQAG